MTPSEVRDEFIEAATQYNSSSESARHRTSMRAWGAFAEAMLERMDEANKVADVERRVADLEEMAASVFNGDVRARFTDARNSTA